MDKIGYVSASRYSIDHANSPNSSDYYSDSSELRDRKKRTDSTESTNSDEMYSEYSSDHYASADNAKEDFTPHGDTNPVIINNDPINAEVIHFYPEDPMHPRGRHPKCCTLF